MSYESLGRFVTRPNPMNPNKWDIGILVPFISAAKNQNQFKPNHVYEIVDVLGAYVIKDLGESSVDLGDGKTKPLYPGLTWAATLEQILTLTENLYILTKNELLNYLNKHK